MASARDLALDVLLAVERDGAFARDALARVRDGVADGRERGLLTELVYGVLRRQGTLDALLATASRLPVEALDPSVRAALRAGLYQVVFLDRVPAHAAVGHAVEAARARTNARLGGYANAVLRNVLRSIEGRAEGDEDPRRDVPRGDGTAVRMRRPVFPDPRDRLADNLAARFSHPPFLVERWLARFGEPATRAALDAGSSRPPIVLRAEPGERDALRAELAGQGVDARAGETVDAVVVAAADETALRPVREGRAAVQDETAQRVVPRLGIRPGDAVLDLCAAPGGKTLHALSLLEGRGEVVACDVAPAKVDALGRLLAERTRGTSVRARAIPVARTEPFPFAPGSFHAVLVDAPCTNTGVLRRRPEVRTRLRPGDPAVLATLQQDLLRRAMPLVAPGGRLVYSTCSVEDEEDEAVVQSVLSDAPGWRRDEGFFVLPSRAADGGFCAVLVRA